MEANVKQVTRCYICGKRLRRRQCFVRTQDLHSDGRPYIQFVGPDCFDRVKRAGADGLPVDGIPNGLRAFQREEWAKAAAECAR